MFFHIVFWDKNNYFCMKVSVVERRPLMDTPLYCSYFGRSFSVFYMQLLFTDLGKLKQRTTNCTESPLLLSSNFLLISIFQI